MIISWQNTGSLCVGDFRNSAESSDVWISPKSHFPNTDMYTYTHITISIHIDMDITIDVYRYGYKIQIH